MKKTDFSFVEGFAGLRSRNSNPQKAFDWDFAAEKIKELFKEHPNLVAEAGLQNDWDYTGGVIFENDKPTNEHYTYLSSNWAIPTLIISWDGEEQIEIPCYVKNSFFDEASKWDKESLMILLSDSAITIKPDDPILLKERN